jgi:hypothetical protein
MAPCLVESGQQGRVRLTERLPGVHQLRAGLDTRVKVFRRLRGRPRTCQGLRRVLSARQWRALR